MYEKQIIQSFLLPNMIDIDFVVPFVDGSDPEWQNRFFKYKKLETCDIATDISISRYRVGVSLRYWFRSVEKYAPWVRKVHLLTDGQLPEWVDLNCKKLNWVKHSDILPSDILPIFNCNPFEVNLHRIPDLAEHFVYFNDDIFLTHTVSPDRFFKDGKPVDMAVLNPVLHQQDVMRGIISNNVSLLNDSFSMWKCVFGNPSKWFSPRYKHMVLRTFLSLLNSKIVSFWEHHLSRSYRKSTFEEVWNQHDDRLQKVTSRFRSASDINQWLFANWQLLKGDFQPMNFLDDSKLFYSIERECDIIVDAILHHKYNIILLNDSEDIVNYEDTIKQIELAFEKTLPEKSAFEI